MAGRIKVVKVDKVRLKIISKRRGKQVILQKSSKKPSLAPLTLQKHDCVIFLTIFIYFISYFSLLFSIVNASGVQSCSL